MIPPIFSRKCLPINLHRIKPALNVQPITPWTRRKFISRRQRRFQKSIWTLDAFRWKLIIDRRRASTRRSPQPWPRIPRNGGGWDPRRNGERTGENARFHSHWLAKMRVRGSHVRWNVYVMGEERKWSVYVCTPAEWGCTCDLHGFSSHVRLNKLTGCSKIGGFGQEKDFSKANREKKIFLLVFLWDSGFKKIGNSIY